MSKLEELQKELADIKAKENEDLEIAKLEREIKARKFAQTKTGKVVNTLGKFGEKITRPNPKTNSKPKQKIKSVEEIMRDLPQ